MSKIYLYPTTEDDFEDYYKVRSDPSDVYWNGYTSAPNKESFKEGFKKRTAKAPFERPEDRRNYLVKEIGTDITAGFTQLIRKENHIEIGYTIIQAYQKKGYGTEALRETVKLAAQFNMPIAVNIRDDNISSQKVALKNGFVQTESYTENEYPEAGTVKLRKYILGCV